MPNNGFFTIIANKNEISNKNIKDFENDNYIIKVLNKDNDKSHICIINLYAKTENDIKPVIKFIMDNNLLTKLNNVRYPDLVYTYCNKSDINYNNNFHSSTKLSDFIDLFTGEFK